MTFTPVFILELLNIFLILQTFNGLITEHRKPKCYV